MASINTYLRLVRPANVVTSVADVLAGIAISGYFLGGNVNYFSVLLLCISTICLYAGGIVFNDVFDAELDRFERPERAIPSGAIRIGQAGLFGTVLLLIGIGSAFAFGILSGIIALGIAIAALMYNKFSKHYSLLGPFNMGVCRGLNLWLGLSILSYGFNQWQILGMIPLMYIFSITMISQGEVHGGNIRNLYIGGILYLLVICFILTVSKIQDNVVLTLIFLLPFAFMILKPLFEAIQEPVGRNIGKAVKAGVISLILMDAAWAAAFGSIYAAVFIACLLPVSLWLAKRFAVT
ncbi:UbiA-like protein EboC [Daejeonella sp. JGW-45]|uniref:UbiA-like protein EboC n=1 Tax=Daejeonella sp. JGW-45 TaxID=3034148 RepID=UPI0023EB8CF3|nr:UbiA-like protein EboC [Daejeonella sp. JGW-45]